MSYENITNSICFFFAYQEKQPHHFWVYSWVCHYIWAIMSFSEQYWKFARIYKHACINLALAISGCSKSEMGISNLKNGLLENVNYLILLVFLVKFSKIGTSLNLLQIFAFFQRNFMKIIRYCYGFLKILWIGQLYNFLKISYYVYMQIRM